MAARDRFASIVVGYGLVIGALAMPAHTVRAAAAYQIYVSNEKSGDVTVIDGSDQTSASARFRSASVRAASTPAPTAKPCMSR